SIDRSPYNCKQQPQHFSASLAKTVHGLQVVYIRTFTRSHKVLQFAINLLGRTPEKPNPEVTLLVFIQTNLPNERREGLKSLQLHPLAYSPLTVILHKTKEQTYEVPPTTTEKKTTAAIYRQFLRPANRPHQLLPPPLHPNHEQLATKPARPLFRAPPDAHSATPLPHHLPAPRVSPPDGSRRALPVLHPPTGALAPRTRRDARDLLPAVCGPAVRVDRGGPHCGHAQRVFGERRRVERAGSG
ncbi:hypothetical protein EV356DRAFT_564731, partial [Viridothelium virens]